MTYLKDFFGNEVLMCALLSWVVAQGIKVLLTLIMDKRLDWRRCFGMGGMPSSHSALTFSLMLMTGLKTGFGSVEFALAFALTAIVIYDAMGVRAETGKQGAALNQILREVLIEGQPITQQRFKELVGHTPLEVAGGIVVGLIMVLIMA